MKASMEKPAPIFALGLYQDPIVAARVMQQLAARGLMHAAAVQRAKDARLRVRRSHALPTRLALAGGLIGLVVGFSPLLFMRFNAAGVDTQMLLLALFAVVVGVLLVFSCINIHC